MTRDQAMQKAIAAGIPAAEITDEDLAVFGYEAPDPTAAMPTNLPAVTDAEVAQDVADAQTEAQSNTTGAQVLDGIAKVGKVAGELLGVAVKK